MIKEKTFTVNIISSGKPYSFDIKAYTLFQATTRAFEKLMTMRTERGMDTYKYLHEFKITEVV